MLCDQVMGVHGDHALVCSTNGDRIYRHNALRNKALHFCEQARLKPELEKRDYWIVTQKPNVVRQTSIFQISLQVNKQL